jgi:hypothetical protein
VPLSPQRALLSPPRKRVSSPFQHDSKRNKVSVGDRDKKLSDATAPEEVPELQLFANLTIEDGAPPLSYWEGLYDQLNGGPATHSCILLFTALFLSSLVMCVVNFPTSFGS